MNTNRWIPSAFLAAALSILAAPTLAADAPTDQGGIASSAFARLKIVQGTAWVRTGDAGEWEESVSNYPLVAGSRVSVPQGSEAEIRFRGSQSLVLPGGSEVDILQLGEQEVSYRLRDGQASLSLPEDNFAPVRVAVPGNREVQANIPGEYSLSTNGESTRFLVSAGTGTVTGTEGSSIAVHAGQEASIGDDVRISEAETAPVEAAPPPALTGTERQAGVPPEVAGELRPYGEWVSTPEYGVAWRPYVDDGWEPYYYGRWTWVSPYGWTWVGYEPWGWWPYHTGWWWPSPAFGWVWCPLRSFVSVDFVFGGSIFHGHHARFFPANVRFFGRDRFVRWVPERPGVIGSRSSSFSRDDTRLTRWNRTVDRGSVMERRDGRTLPVTSGRGTGISRAERTGVSPPGSRTRDAGAVRATNPRGGNVAAPRSRPGNDGGAGPSVRRGGGTRSYNGGAGRVSGSAGIRKDPARSYRSSPGMRSRGDGRAFRSSISSGSPGSGRSFRSSVSGGSPGSGRSFRSSVSGGSPGSGRSFRSSVSGGSRGSGASFRGSSGGWSRGSGRGVR